MTVSRPTLAECRLQLVLVALVSCVAMAELAWGVLLPARVPTPESWTAVSAQVRKEFRQGDLLVFSPDWMDQMGRSLLGDLIPVEMAARADDDRFPRVWEIALDAARYPVEQGRLAAESRHGRLTLRRYDKPSTEVLYDFTSHARKARVVSARGDDERPCLVDVEGGFRCPAGLVEPRTLEIDYRPRRGLLIPSDASRATRIEFEAVPGGHTLVGYLGLHDYYSRKNGSGAIDVKVLIDGIERAALRYLQEEGWRRFEIDLSALPGVGTGTHRVRFDVSAAAPALRRSVGLHAEVRR